MCVSGMGPDNKGALLTALDRPDNDSAKFLKASMKEDHQMQMGRPGETVFSKSRFEG